VKCRRSATISLGLLALLLFVLRVWPSELSYEIAFVSDRDGYYDIYTTKPFDPEVRRLTNTPQAEWHVNWSPDGNHLLCAADYEGNFDIYTALSDGTHPHKLTSNSANEWCPALSPDGEKLAFILNEQGTLIPGRRRVYVMDLKTGSVTRVTKSQGEEEYRPSWSPDSRSIAFTSNRSGNWQIYIMDSRGERYGIQQLTDLPGGAKCPAWSPDGRKIAFDSAGDIMVVELESGELKKLTSDGTGNGYPSWSPDGEWIAFQSHRDGNAEIYVIRSNGSQLRRVTRDPANDWEPVWRPLPQASWWVSTESIEALTQELAHRLGAREYEICRDGRYVLILLALGLKRVTLFGLELGLPVYKVVFFDTLLEEFMPGIQKDRENAQRLYRQFYLRRHQREILDLAEDYVCAGRDYVEELKKTDHNPLFLILGPAMSAFAQATLVAYVSQNPSLAVSQIRDSFLGTIFAFEHAAHVKARLEGNVLDRVSDEAVQKIVGYAELTRKAGPLLTTLKKTLKHISYYQFYYKKLGEYEVWYDLAKSNLQDMLGILVGALSEAVFPTQSVSEAAFYLYFAGDMTEAAESLLDKVSGNISRFRSYSCLGITSYNWVFQSLRDVFTFLSYAYYYAALAVEKCKAGLTGALASFIHDVWSRSDVDDKIRFFYDRYGKMREWVDHINHHLFRVLFLTSAVGDGEFMELPVKD